MPHGKHQEAYERKSESQQYRQLENEKLGDQPLFERSGPQFPQRRHHRAGLKARCIVGPRSDAFGGS